jgi:hypothetical protein
MAETRVCTNGGRGGEGKGGEGRDERGRRRTREKTGARRSTSMDE